MPRPCPAYATGRARVTHVGKSSAANATFDRDAPQGTEDRKKTKQTPPSSRQGRLSVQWAILDELGTEDVGQTLVTFTCTCCLDGLARSSTLTRTFAHGPVSRRPAVLSWCNGVPRLKCTSLL